MYWWTGQALSLQTRWIPADAGMTLRPFGSAHGGKAQNKTGIGENISLFD